MANSIGSANGRSLTWVDALVSSAGQVVSTLVIAAAAHAALVLNAYFILRTIAVFSTQTDAIICEALFSQGAVFVQGTSGSAAALLAAVISWTVGFGHAHPYHAGAANHRVATEERRTSAYLLVGNGLADRVLTASSRGIAKVFATVQYAGLSDGAVVVASASWSTLSCLADQQADFFVQAVTVVLTISEAAAGLAVIGTDCA